MTRLHWFVALALLAVVLVGCTQPGSPVAPPVSNVAETPVPSPAPNGVVATTPATGFLRFEGGGYAIDYPADWDIQETGPFTSFVSPSEGEGVFRENVNVFAAELQGEARDLSIEELIEASFEDIRNSVEGFHLLDVAETTLGGEHAQKLVYRGTSEGISLVYQQVAMVKDGTLHSFTFAGREEKYAALEPQLEAMTASFALTGAVPETSGAPANQESPSSASSPAMVGKWRVYSEAVYYDSGGRNWLDAPVSRLLEVKADNTWSFGSSKGTWDVKDISDADWERWQTQPYGPTRKMVLYGWNNDFGDGPVEEGGERVDFFWMIYRAGPPVVSSPGQIQMKFGHSNA